MNITKGSLCIVINNGIAEYFWQGKPIIGIKRAHLDLEDKDFRVKLVIHGIDDSLYMDMTNNGIIVKKV